MDGTCIPELGGRVRCTYTLPCPGFWVLEVTAGGRHLRGSPFSVQVGVLLWVVCLQSTFWGQGVGARWVQVGATLSPVSLRLGGVGVGGACSHIHDLENLCSSWLQAHPAGGVAAAPGSAAEVHQAAPALITDQLQRWEQVRCLWVLRCGCCIGGCCVVGAVWWVLWWGADVWQAGPSCAGAVGQWASVLHAWQPPRCWRACACLAGGKAGLCSRR